MNNKKYLFLISLDSVSDDDVNILKNSPFFSRLLKKNGVLVRNVKSVFLSNTYPSHTSVITGVYPDKHGVIENTFPTPYISDGEKPFWRWHRGNIRTTTLFDEAKKAGLSTCSIFWPVTASADITYNMPEIFKNRKNQSQLFTSLINGSASYQLEMLVKFFYKVLPFNFNLKGLDNFSTAVACETIKKYKPNLMMIHLCDMDGKKHKYGLKRDIILNTISDYDARLEKIVTAIKEAGIYDDSHIIVFGDHASKDVHANINLNKYISQSPDLKNKAFFHNAGGTCFLKIIGEPGNIKNKIIEIIEQFKSRGIVRYLTDDEMKTGGFYGRYALGLEACDGVCFGDANRKKRGQHGYTPGLPDYATFYSVFGKTARKFKETSGISEISGGCIVDICALAAKILGLPSWDMDGKIHPMLM
ncbi:MAG: ectonucleotide pyrophosphatase/phosphodiesterase [Oscillospiraceae bacterium]|nr:ectonucleotide pyrophosphatase/phosphodiesterase [Oscillospiraceae bacterium]